MLGTLRLYLRPSMFLLHVPALAALVAALLLGSWQLDSWRESRQDRSAELAGAAPVPLADVMDQDDPYPASAVGRPVSVAGEWVERSTVYISGKEHEGAAAAWKVAVLATCDGAAGGCQEPAGLPIVLGWGSLEELRSLPAPSGSAELTGWLQPGEGPGDPDPDPSDEVLTSLRIATLLQRGDRDMYGAFLLLDEPAALRAGMGAVTPDTLPEPPTSTALRNLLYGLEWWLFAGFAVFLWWRWTRDEVARARAAAADVAFVSDPVATEREDQEARLPSRP